MDDVHAQARTLLAEQAYAKVAEALRPHLSDHPDDAEGWELLAAALCSTSSWQKAETAAGRVVSLRPQDVRAWSNWGMTLRKCGRRDEAEDALSKALQLDPAYARTHPAVERVSRSGRTEVGQRNLEWKAAIGVVGLALLLAMVLIVGVHGCLSSSQEPPPDQAALDAAVGQRVQAFGKVTQGMSYSEVASLWGSPSGTYSENDNRIAGPGEAGGPGKYECTWYRDPKGSDGDLTGAIVRFSNGVVTGILPTGDWAVHK